MKALNFREFKQYATWCESMLSGAQLQEIRTNDELVVLEFYKYQSVWLVIDLSTTQPQFVLCQEESPNFRHIPKPCGLFLNSHGKNLRVQSFQPVPELGRVARLELSGGGRQCVVELQLVPRSPNLIVESGGKKITWAKPQDLAQVADLQQDQDQGAEIDPAEWLDREQQWKSARLTKPARSAPAGEQKNRALEKKNKALEALRKQLQSDESTKLRTQASELLQTKPTEAQKLFEKAKQLEGKQKGTEQRIQILLGEIAKLSVQIQNPESVDSKTAPKASLVSQKLKKADAGGRKLQLSDSLEAVCGKSAKDNLSILRQSRAWDYWMHLKDYPGAHAIIFREKKQNVSRENLQKVAEWMIRESKAAKGFSFGGAYDVVVVECRFVKPIKGDKLGRVTYTHPQVYTFASSAKS